MEKYVKELRAHHGLDNENNRKVIDFSHYYNLKLVTTPRKYNEDVDQKKEYYFRVGRDMIAYFYFVEKRNSSIEFAAAAKQKELTENSFKFKPVLLNSSDKPSNVSVEPVVAPVKQEAPVEVIPVEDNKLVKAEPVVASAPVANKQNGVPARNVPVGSSQAKNGQSKQSPAAQQDQKKTKK
jgi:hypothetical protein